MNKPPQKETLNFFNDIKNFINRKKSQNELKQNLQLRETIKMPYKMYNGIKQSVIKKYNKNEEMNKMNNIIGESNLNSKKLMTKIIETKIEEEKISKKNLKLKFSYGKNKSKFKDGILKIGKGFINSLSKPGNQQRDYSQSKRPFKPKIGGKKA